MTFIRSAGRARSCAFTRTCAVSKVSYFNSSESEPVPYLTIGSKRSPSTNQQTYRKGSFYLTGVP